MGSEISGAVSGVTTPGASRLQASQSQQRSTTMQRLHLLKVGRPRDDLGPLPPSPPPDRVHIQRPPPRDTQTDYHLNQAPPPLPQKRKHPRTVQLSFLQPHFMVPRPSFQMVLRKFQHGAVCFPGRLAPSPLPRLPMDVISFVSHCPTCEHLVQTYIQCWRPPFTTVVSQWWSATTHVGERRNFVRGLVPMSLYTKLTTPPSGRRRPAHCHDLKLALKARVPLLLNALYRTLEWLNDNPPPAPLTPPTGPNSWGRPWSPYSTSHTVLQRPPPPAYHPPPPLSDKVVHKPPKRPRPPSPAAHAEARKHAHQPPRPVRPLSLKRNTASQPQPEPPPPKRPLTIRDMFNLPPPPRPAPPLAASAPVSAPSPRITRYFAPAPPSAASTNSHSSSSSSNVSSL